MTEHGAVTVDGEPHCEVCGALETLTRHIEMLEANVRHLQRLLAEHHAVGVMEGYRVGDQCPICRDDL